MKTPMRHIAEEQLLPYADGELKPRAAGQVRAHLETCWECRAGFQELQNTVNACVRYRKNVLVSHLPPPPAPWMDIYQKFERIDASMEPVFFPRLVRMLQWPARSAARWVPVAAALLLLGVLFLRYRETPSVHAAELLRKAVAAADSHPAKVRAIHIRTARHSFTRPAGHVSLRASSPADAEAAGSVQALFRAANYDWENPLSARSYQAWRDQLSDKRDTVTESADSVRIRTDAPASELVHATLTLRTQDLEPVQERLEFRNQDWVEITAVSESAAAPETIAAAPAVRASAEPAAPAPAPVIAPPAEAGIGDMLHVWVALHNAGADLGDPVEISRAGGKVVVSGAGIAPDRRQQIQSALAAQPNVVVRFTEAVPTQAAPQRVLPERAAAGGLQRLQDHIADQVGGRASYEELASRVVDLSEPMMARAYALRRLAEQFPADAESQLSPADRQLLRDLRSEHTAALRRHAAELETALRPVTGTVRPAAETPRAVWQAATEDLFQSARQVDKLLAVMFGSAPGDSTVDQLAARLSSNLALLHARLDAYDRNEK